MHSKFASTFRFFLLFLPSISACNSGNSESNLKQEVSGSRPPLYTCDTRNSVLLSFKIDQAKIDISEILARMPGESCLANVTDNHLCGNTLVGFNSKIGKSTSLGQRILIMDSGFHVPAMTRYKSRVLDFVESDEFGNFKTIDEKISVNNAANEIYSLLDKKYAEVPPVFFEQEAGMLAQKVGKSYFRPQDPGREFGHGTIIFTKLAEYNPNSEFVLVDAAFSFSFSKEMKASGINPCDLPNDEKWEEKYASFLKHQSSQIMGLIKKHHINFVNFSFSESEETLKLSFQHTCKDVSMREDVIQKMLQIQLKNFIEPLHTIQNVIVVQAIGTGEDYSSEKIRKKNLIDCTSFPNSVRVGVMGHLDSGIPPEGSSDISLFPDWGQRALVCTDLVINMGPIDYSGWENSAKKPQCGVRFSATGFSIGQFPDLLRFSTSYAAPLALSYLIYLKNTLPPGTSTAEIIRTATGDGKKFIKDPIRHRQIEVYRLGYLDP